MKPKRAGEEKMFDPDDNIYELVMGSDVSERDGMYLELNNGLMKADPMAEVFYSDVDNTMSITTFRNSLPLEKVEWMIAEAKRRLPPRG